MRSVIVLSVVVSLLGSSGRPVVAFADSVSSSDSNTRKSSSSSSRSTVPQSSPLLLQAVDSEASRRRLAADFKNIKNNNRRLEDAINNNEEDAAAEEQGGEDANEEAAAATTTTTTTISQGNCFRMKIKNDNNDDDGNSYFYNGAYRAQYKRYLSYQVCTSSSSSSDSSSSSSCHEYVSGLEEYLEQAVPFVQTYCGACASNCGYTYNGGRFLEENTCKTCLSKCKLLLNSSGAAGTDESTYLDCQAAAAGNNNNGGEEEGDGAMEYYTAPQCEKDQVVIGHFYDNECTLKTSTLTDEGFSYNTFRTLSSLALSCATEDGGDDDDSACANLLANAVQCDTDEQNDASLCKAAAAAARINTYYTQPFYKKVPITLIFILLFSLSVGLGFLVYTYFVRHQRSNKTLTPMAQLDELPPIS